MKLPSLPDAPAAREHTPDLAKGRLAIFATVAIWSTPSLFMFYLNRSYDPYAQNLYRYAAGFLAVLPFVLWRYRRHGGLRLDRRLLLLCLLPALPNVVHQVTQVVSLFYMGPGVYAIFTRSSVIITAILALVFFPEERSVIRQWQFQLGTAFGLVGAVGVVLFQPGWEAGEVPLAGLGIAFLATFSWALYGVLVKAPSAELGPVRSFGVISLFTSLMLVPLTLALGDIGTPLRVGWEVNVILVFSAVTCISLAHVLYYIAIRELGVALSQTLQLLCPALALGLSAWIFEEKLTPAQLWSAGLLLVGAFLAMQVKPGATSQAAEQV
ncbi:MAG: DMT family transporter [Chthoniobacterales bacterium]|nr:DMT family transporter [Chthoniobacterales bacterium]